MDYDEVVEFLVSLPAGLLVNIARVLGDLADEIDEAIICDTCLDIFPWQNTRADVHREQKSSVPILKFRNICYHCYDTIKREAMRKVVTEQIDTMFPNLKAGVVATWRGLGHDPTDLPGQYL